MANVRCRPVRAEEIPETINLFLTAGINHAGIHFALQTGLRLTGYAHLLTSAPFGRMEQYIPSGPSLF
jgi:hypothetical protein